MSTEETVKQLRAQVTDFTATLDVPPFVHEINDLVNKQMYARAAVEEQEAIALIADMWAIVKALAETDPYMHNDNNGKMECLFCMDSYGWGKDESHAQRHGAECIALRAEKLVEQRHGQ